VVVAKSGTLAWSAANFLLLTWTDGRWDLVLSCLILPIFDRVQGENKREGKRREGDETKTPVLLVAQNGGSGVRG